jgi:polyisoprenoid-binding protein YceI
MRRRSGGRLIKFAKFRCDVQGEFHAISHSMSRSIRRAPVTKPGTGSCFQDCAGRSSAKFSVKASVALEGTFEKWDATVSFTSPDISTGVLEIKIQADSVNTGSGMNDGKLKSKDFFDVKDNPTITLLSKKIVTDILQIECGDDQSGEYELISLATFFNWRL